jgi:hypothetical protein
MAEIVGHDCDVHFGEIDRPLPDWREDESLLNEEDPDDELLIPTPADVVAILGFDPLDIWKKDKEELEEK